MNDFHRREGAGARRLLRASSGWSRRYRFPPGWHGPPGRGPHVLRAWFETPFWESRQLLLSLGLVTWAYRRVTAEGLLSYSECDRKREPALSLRERYQEKDLMESFLLF